MLSTHKPVFSLCHSTARLPDGWVEAFKTWIARADHPEQVEYILGVDKGREHEAAASVQETFWRPKLANRQVISNLGRRCAVDGWNATAAASTGKILITVSDDWMPPEHWDTELLACIPESNRIADLRPNPDGSLSSGPDLNGEYVFDVNTGGAHALLTFSLLTRAYYERYGRIFYHEYIGMYADNDFTEQAKRDGVIINARHLKFPHAHPAYGTAETDETYAWQHRDDAWETGKRVLKSRWPNSIRDTLICACPGATYSSAWVSWWTGLHAQLLARFNVQPAFCYSSNVYVTRACMAKSFVENGFNAPADFILWIDDDNILSIEQFSLLFEDLEKNPDLDGVVAWCWIAADVYDIPKWRVSCGDILPDGSTNLYTLEELMAGPDIDGGTENPLKPITHSGFPVFLMRERALRKLGKHPFMPIISDKFQWGFSGEDSSYFHNAQKAGLKFAVDRRVKVPHLKLRSADPPGLTVANLWKAESDPRVEKPGRVVGAEAAA